MNTSHYGAVSYHHGPAYGAQKAGLDKIAAYMAKALRAYNVVAISVWMGELDTESAREYLKKMPPRSHPAIKC